MNWALDAIASVVDLFKDPCRRSFDKIHYEDALLFVWALLAFVMAGCSQEKLDEMVSNVKDKAQVITQAAVVAEVIPATGHATINVSPPVKVNVAYARLYATGDGRPAVVQFTTYDPDKGPQNYPALLVRATTPATSLESLAGQSLSAKVFFQQSSAHGVLSSGDEGLVAVEIAPLDPNKKTLDATIPAGSLVDAMGTPTTLGGITIEGVLP